MKESAPLLTLSQVSRSFGGVRAVDAISFSVAAGTVHGLIGPNGAGKTTVLNLISGLIPLTGGSISLAGHRLDGLPSHRIAALGVRRTFQNIRLFPAMSALDNVVVGEHLPRRVGLLAQLAATPQARTEERQAGERAQKLLERVQLSGRIDQPARNLSYGEQRRLEIARALAGRPRLLLLDEPAAGMPHAEVQHLAALIRSLAGSDTTTLLVEHNMDLVMAVSDRITVLDFGRVIAEGPPAAIRADRDVIRAYLGDG